MSPLAATLASPERADELKLDELWTYVGRRLNKRWLWLALCRRTRQVVAYALGARDTATARVLLGRLPPGYRTCRCHTDAWSAYAEALPRGQHQPRQQAGPTNHVERFNATLRHATPRYAPAWGGSCAKP